jgi:hypothetical protein
VVSSGGLGQIEATTTGLGRWVGYFKVERNINEEPAISPPPEVMERLERITDVGEATQLYERLWTEVKAAGP